MQAMDGLRIRSLWWSAGDHTKGTPKTASFMSSSMKKASALSIIVALDTFGMAIVFLLVCYFQHRLLVMDRDMHNQATIADYSVMVSLWGRHSP